MKRTERQFEISGGALIINMTDLNIPTIDAKLIANFVEIVSLDGEDGSPVVPGAGDYTINVQQVRDGNFRGISDGGTVDATLTGGSAMADGTGVSSSFQGAPQAIKITPNGVTTATWARVTVDQYAAT